MSTPVVIRTDVPPPPGPKGYRRYDWDRIPVGASFEVPDDVSPQAVVSAFAAHLARGKYRLRRGADGRYRFWRLG